MAGKRLWGNALGGWRKQARDSNGRFGHGKTGSLSRKKSVRGKSRKTPRSQYSRTTKNSVQYDTKVRKRYSGGYTVDTYAHKKGSLVGYTNTSVRGGEAKIVNVYLTKENRGKGLSKEMLGIHQGSLKNNSLAVSRNRSLDGDRLAKNLLGEKAGKRKAKSDKRAAAITKNMDENVWVHDLVLDDVLSGSKKKGYSRSSIIVPNTTGKKYSKKRKAAIGSAVVVGASAAMYAYEYQNVKREFNRTGAISTFTDKNGVSFTQERKFRKGRKLSLNEEALGALMESGSKWDSVRETLALADFSIRPQIDTTTWIHKGDDLLGYSKTVTQRNRLRANVAFLKKSERGAGRTVAAASRYMKIEQKEAVGSGRKIVVHRYRSADSERVVRNQRKNLGKKNVIVQRRFNPKSNMSGDIIKSLDDDFFYNKKDQFKKVQAKQKKRRVVI